MAKILAIACDHAGVTYKKDLIANLTGKGYTCINLGTDTEESVDYPIYADAVCKKVTSGEADLGILICGTGIGVSIAANKVKGAYAACIHDVYQAQRAELSNHANIITMGSQVVGVELAKCMVKEYLSVTYDPNSRSAPKLERIYEYEKNM